MIFSSKHLEEKFKNLDTDGLTPFVSALVFDIVDENYGGVIENLNITHIELPNISGYFHSPRAGNRRLKIDFLINGSSIVLTPQNLEIIDDDVEKIYLAARSLSFGNINKTNYLPIEFFNFAQRQMNCTVGWSCEGQNGYACLSKSKKNCNNELNPTHSQYMQWLAKNASAESDLFKDLEKAVTKPTTKPTTKHEGELDSKTVVIPENKQLDKSEAKPSELNNGGSKIKLTESDSIKDILAQKREWSDACEKSIEENIDNKKLKTRLEDSYEIHDIISSKASNNKDNLNFKTIKDENNTIQSVAMYTKDDKNSSIFVKLLASAPWNITGNEEKSVKGAGTELILSLIQESQKLGYGGRITLSPIGDAEGFYDKLGFTKFIHNGSEILELKRESAENLLKKTGKNQ